MAWRNSCGCGAGEDFNYPATTGDRPHKSWAERQIGAYIADLIEIAPRDASVFSDIIPVRDPYYNIAHSSELLLQERPWYAEFIENMPVLQAKFMYALSPSSHRGHPSSSMDASLAFGCPFNKRLQCKFRAEILHG